MAQFITLPPVYPILDTATLDRLGLDWVSAAEALIEGGAQILQIRHKSFWSRDAFSLAEKITGLCRSGELLFVINDRAVYAALLGAATKSQFTAGPQRGYFEEVRRSSAIWPGQP